VGAIVAAGGRGRRFGGGTPKQLLELEGRTVLQRSIDAIDRCDAVAELVVVLPPDLIDSAGSGLVSTKPLRVVAGGERRQDSVGNGFDALAPEVEVVVVHDAARPFASPDLFRRTVAAAHESGAAVAAVPASDTVKLSTGDALPMVARTLPRESVYLAQTPQAFRRDVLEAAIALGRSGVEGTDEAALAERAGHQVRIVDGEAANIKITTESDMALARGILGTIAPSELRTGFGYDLHRLAAGRPLILAGIDIPSDVGLIGHSDADAVCHAVTDALLGAAAQGDIGAHFPDTDPRWRGASSIDLLQRAVVTVREAGFNLVNVDVTVIAERPKIRRHVDAMRARLSEAIQLDAARISIKGKTNEGVGEIGRGEAIAVHAVATIRR
jgi:2-C-methyl-D-erythritol 4-phosphate cytidylyltransferase/2-C-methyl-D-erythritol 2,4-cyclodiphosphate synthase